MSAEIDTIAARLTDRLLASVPRDLDDRTRDLLDRQQPDGSWPDVDYDDESRTHWKPSRHLYHLDVLAHAYRVPDADFHGDRAVADAFRRGLRFWVDRHPVSDNWWFNVIGAPRRLSDVLLLMIDELPADLVASTAELIRESGFTRTGANLVDEASNLLTFAAATGDADLLRESIEHISKEVRITTEEGIQADDSFHQHGPQQMIISYGRGFAFDQAGFAELFAGTPFAYSDDKIRILSRFILDAQQWFIRGRQVDYHAMGRGAFRGHIGAHVWNAGGYARLAERMAVADPARAPEYAAFADRVTGEEPPGASGPLGNKHFWRSETMVQRERDWYASVRFHSERVYATETRTNRENLKGYHLSDGVYMLLRRGDEYHEIQPVWQYRKLPGLTFLDTDAPIPYGRDVPRAGNTTFVGGASDGLSGVSVMDYDKGGVRAKKAYFFNADGWVCLGAGISSDESERVLTTLNQCRLKSDVTILRSGETEKMTDKSFEASDVRIVHHDGVVYELLSDAAIEVTAKEQTGSWQDVEARASDESAPQDVFTCAIDHGSRPDDASYAYRIIPDVEVTALSDVLDGARILSNTKDLQAVHVPGEDLTQAVFHVPGTLDLADGRTLTSDTPCALVLHETSDAAHLTVADPNQSSRQIVFDLEGRYRGDGASILAAGRTHVVVKLPQAESAGSSVTLTLERIQ